MIFNLLLAFLFSTLAVSKQVYMATVFRHGARYPTNNLYDGKQTAPFHGQLTAVGLRQQYLLGNYIQNDYMRDGALLNNTYTPRQVEIFSLFDSQRCVQSAYGHALGLFSFLNGETIDQNLDKALLEPPFETIFPDNLKSQAAPSDFALQFGFQPVPIRNGNSFFPKCQNQNKIFIQRGEKVVKQFAEIQAEFALLTEQMRILFNLTLAETNIGGLTQLYDTLVCDNYLGRPLPSKLTDQEYQKLSFIQRYLFALVYEEKPARIFNAPFVNSLISNMENVIKGKLGVKRLSVYSGHDSNVVPLLVYFNLTSSECLKKQFKNHKVDGNCAVPVPFASNIFFELHRNDQDSSDYFVKIRYNGRYYNLCEKSSTECSFQQFAKRSIGNLLDFQKYCAKPTSPELNILLSE